MTEQTLILISKDGDFGVVKLEVAVAQSIDFVEIKFADGVEMVRKYVSDDEKVCVYQEK